MSRWTNVEVVTVTPLAMGGARQRGAGSAEPLRARSLRGLLRTWTRFLLGSRLPSEKLWELERELYGGVHEEVRESSIKVRAKPVTRPQANPWGTGDNGNEGPHGEREEDARGAYLAGVRYLGELSFRELPERPDRPRKPARHLIGPGHQSVVGLRYIGNDDNHEWLMWASFWLLVHLGGVGSRATRAFGSLAVQGSAPEVGLPWSFGFDAVECATKLRAGLEDLHRSTNARFGTPIRRPNYGTIDYTTVDVLDPPFASAIEAQRYLGNALFAYRHHQEPDTTTMLSGASGILERPAWGLPLTMPAQNGATTMLQPDGLREKHDRWPSPIAFRVQQLESSQYALVAVARDVPLVNAKEKDQPHRTFGVEVDGSAAVGAIPRLLKKFAAEERSVARVTKTAWKLEQAWPWP